MKEKLWPSVIVAGAIVFSAVLVCVFAGRPVAADATPHSPVAARDTYKIGKVEAIMDKVIAREAIEDAYFYFLDGDVELIAALEEHNEQAARWRLNFTRTAIDTMAGVLMMEKGSDGKPLSRWADRFLQTPPEVGALIETVGRYSLYRNCEWLLESDPALARIIAPESGGSAGAWPFLWHTGYLSSEDVRESLTQFFDFEDDLLRRLDAFRVGLLG